MLKKIPKDHLTDRTIRALAEAIALSKERGRIFPIVSYETVEGSRSLPFEFDDFMVAIRDARITGSYLRLATSMGSGFIILSLTMREIVDCPQRLATERAAWDDTLISVLKSIRPWSVVFVDFGTAGALGIACAESRTPAIVAIGLHPTRIMGLAAVCAPSSVGGMFLPVVIVEDGIARALGTRWYRRIYAPGVS